MVWVVKYLPSYEYFTFNDVITRLDAIGSIHSSNRDFLDDKYHALHGKFDNEVTSRVSAFFVRELPTTFGRAEPFPTVLLCLLFGLSLSSNLMTRLIPYLLTQELNIKFMIR